MITVPDTYNGTTATPLIIYFHGQYGSFKSDSAGFSALGLKKGYITVAPKGMEDGHPGDTSWSVKAEGAAINWHNKFMEIMSTCIPHQSLRRRRNVPWLTMNIIWHIRMRNATFQAARKSSKPAQHSKYRKLRNKVVKMMRNAKSSYFKNLNPRNRKQFWKAVKYLNKQQSTIPTLSYHDATAESDSEKASLLNEFFSTCFNRDIPPLSPADADLHTVRHDLCPDGLLCTADKVLFLITSLDSSKANGPDGISAQMLKGTALSIAPSLAKLFNISISQGEIILDNNVATPKHTDHGC